MMMSSIQRMVAAAAALAPAALLAGCGSGGAGGQGGAPAGGGSGGVSEASVLDVTTSVPTIGSDGKTIATITAFVKDAGNRALANQFVDFSTSDTGSLLQVASIRTDATGTAAATLTITDPTNRGVNVLVKSGSIAKTLSVNVVGTALTLDGPTSLVSNAQSEFTVALRDSSGAVISGKPVQVKSSAGNALSSSSLVTDAAGRAKFIVTGTKSGADTLTVTALGTSASLNVTVASTQLSFTSPTPGQELEVGLAQPVSVNFLVSGSPQAGRTVEFFATRGTITATATTDASGRASATISASTAGVSTITARADGVLSSQHVEFVSRTPAKLSLQASPANVGVNLTPSSTNSSQLIAVVRDANDNPVKGQTVTFSADQDPSNGKIEPAVATTDSSGVASVAFFPGANSTGNQAIVMRASIPGKGVAGTTTLTASRQELIVRVGTGNAIEILDAVSYGMPWDAVVTDSSGNPVANATVQASLVGTAFYKGGYYPSGEFWEVGGDDASKPRFKCNSEDANGNLRLDAGEDTNGDGQLTPGNVAAAQVLAEGGRTDASGFARIRVKYPKEFGNWTRVRLTVSITAIAGTEGTATREFDLPVAREDLKIEAFPPGGVVSPFGRVPDCTTTN